MTYRLHRHLTVAIGLFLAAALCATTIGVDRASAKKNTVTVFPLPKTPVAGKETSFSFRGIKPGKMGPIRVVGSQSGRVGGFRVAHSDGRGVSWVPNKEFQSGEKVTVYTKRGVRRSNKGKFWVRIGRFYGKEDEGAPGEGFDSPSAPLNSRPSIRPPVYASDPEGLVAEGAEPAPGKIFVAPKKEGMSIIDNEGRTVWFRKTDYGGFGDQIMNFQTQKYRGRPVLTYWRGNSAVAGYSQVGRFEILNRKYNRIASFEPGNGYKADTHEFDITPRNTALVLAYEGVYWNTSKWGGSRDTKVIDNVIQEIDIKTGAVLFEWHSLGNVSVGASKADPDTVGWGATPDPISFDYFHVNSAVNDGPAILISARRTSTIYRISRTTGRVLWRLRGDGFHSWSNDFKMGEGTTFGWQHDIRRTKEGHLILFDNAQGRGVPSVADESSGLVLRLSNMKSKNNKRATLVKRFTHPREGGVLSQSQANARQMPNGNVFVGWGQVGRFSEFTPEGDLALDFTFNPTNVQGNISYRAFKAPWNGIPKGNPAIASEAGDPGAGTVWASWNGATIKAWKVLSGDSADSLSEVGEVPWDGLETEIEVVDGLGDYVQVVAIDYRDEEFGRSAVTQVGEQSSGQ